MNKEHVREWVDALRSGRYVQGGGYLTQIEDGVRKDCCLGVVCDLASVPEHSRRDWPKMPHDEGPAKIVVRYVDEGPGSDSEQAVLPYSAQEWLGMETSDPVIAEVTEEMIESGVVSREWLAGAGVGKEITAAAANDDLHWTFEQIADAVEARYLAA